MNNNIRHPLIKFISFSYKCYKPYFFVALITCIVKALEIIFNAYSLSILISFLEKNNYQESLIAGGVIVGINFFFYFFNKLSYKMCETESQKLEMKINEAISNKLMSVPFQNLENPEFLDLKERAKMGINNFGSVYRIINNGIKIIQNLFILIGLGSIMGMFDYRLLIILFVSVILDILFIAISLSSQIKLFRNLVPSNRKFGYYISTVSDLSKGKDYRLNRGIGEMLSQKFQSFSRFTISEFTKLYNKMSLVNSMQKIVSYVELALVYIIIALRVAQGGLSISTFSLYVSSAISFTTAVVSLIDGGLDVIQCVQYIIPVLQLMNTKNDNEIGKQIIFNKQIETLEFKNVSFAYPKSNSLILSSVSFKINKGEKISLVGLNGAGKTTIVKLITRLYKPQEGEILVNGININDYEYKSYIKEISAVFQDFKLFAYSLKENILNGDGDSKEAYDIACSVGLKEKIDSLEDGIDSLYMKSYEEKGIELSGGEGQKVAIARAIYANSSLVILDEPTSALDPLAEEDIYKNFNSLVKNKTALYISHRMSSSVFCDRILVLNGGIVEDFDTHSNLMKKTDSLYYKLFNAQAKNYAK